MAEGTFNLCQLYDAFKALEDAFGSFADMLYGIMCVGVNCDQVIEVDKEAVDDLAWLERTFTDPGGGGRDHCTTSPQKVLSEEFLRLVTAYVEHTPGVVTALGVLLKRASMDEIEFLTRRDRESVKG